MRAATQLTRASRPFSLNQTGTLSRRHLAHFVAAVDTHASPSARKTARLIVDLRQPVFNRSRVDRARRSSPRLIAGCPPSSRARIAFASSARSVLRRSPSLETPWGHCTICTERTLRFSDDPWNATDDSRRRGSPSLPKPTPAPRAAKGARAPMIATGVSSPPGRAATASPNCRPSPRPSGSILRPAPKRARAARRSSAGSRTSAGATASSGRRSTRATLTSPV